MEHDTVVGQLCSLQVDAMGQGHITPGQHSCMMLLAYKHKRYGAEAPCSPSIFPHWTTSLPTFFLLAAERWR
jgi:hypothetical protein